MPTGKPFPQPLHPGGSAIANAARTSLRRVQRAGTARIARSSRQVESWRLLTQINDTFVHELKDLARAEGRDARIHVARWQADKRIFEKLIAKP